MRLLVRPVPAYCGMVAAGKGGSGGGGARAMMVIEVTFWLSPGRPSILRSAYREMGD